MGELVNLYKFKVKVFFGAFRASRSTALLFVIYALSLVPSTLVMSTVVVDAVRREIDLKVQMEAISAVISCLLALVLASTIRGFTVFEYEQNYVFTCPVSPRSFVVAAMLADITASSFFVYPLFIFLGVVTLSLGLSAVSVLSTAVLVVFFVFFVFFLRGSLSILGSVYQNSRIKLATAFAIFLLLFPAIGLVTTSPLSYGALPYPATLLAQSLMDFLYGKLPPVHVFLGLLSYFAGSLMLMIFSSRENLFQFATSVPFVSPFDASMRTQTVKMGKNIRFFSRVGLRISLDPESGTLLRFLMKKEAIRMVRDGSLFMVLFLYCIVFIMTVATGLRETPFPMTVFLLAVYSLIVPSMLVGNWRLTELDSLWIPLTTSVNFGYVIRSLLYDWTLISFIIPAVTVVLLALGSQIRPLIPLTLVASVSMIGCSTNLYVITRFLGRKRRSTPLMMISWMSFVLSGLFLAPTYAFVSLDLLLNLSEAIGLLVSVPIIVYSAMIMFYLAKKSEKNAVNLEI